IKAGRIQVRFFQRESTGCFSIESVFAAFKGVFLKFEALHEAASRRDKQLDVPFVEKFVGPAGIIGTNGHGNNEQVSIDDIRAALAAGDRRRAVEMRLEIQRREGKTHSRAKLFAAAGYTSKTEFCAWQRGEKRIGSASDKNFRR